MRSLLLLLSLVALAEPRTAEACSQPLCWPGAFLPGDGATIPANAPGLYWRPTSSAVTGDVPDPALVRLTRADDPTTPLPFTAVPRGDGDYVLVPGADFLEGVSYVLEDRATCGGEAGPRVTFTAGPRAPLPTTLGTVSVNGHGLRDEIDVATAAGSCSTKVDAEWIDVTVSPSATASPWVPLFLFETYVDGQPWTIQSAINVRPKPGESWKGRGRDTLFRSCIANTQASYPGVSIGGHDVAFRATLPMTTATLATPATAVELMCDAHPPVDDAEPPADSGCSTSAPGASALALIALLFTGRCSARRRSSRRAGAPRACAGSRPPRAP